MAIAADVKRIGRLISWYFATVGVLAHLAVVGAIAFLVVAFPMPLPLFAAKVVKHAESVVPWLAVPLDRGFTLIGADPDAPPPTRATTAGPPLDRWTGQGASAAAPRLTQIYDAQGRPAGTRPFAPTDITGRAVEVATMRGLIAAVAAARPGDVITLAPGVYRSRVSQGIITTIPGTADRPITVRADRLGAVKIEIEATIGFKIASPYWIFENLDIGGVCARHSTCEHAFQVIGRGRSLVLRNNRLHDFNAPIKGNGIEIDGARSFPDDALIENNSIYNNTPRKTDNPVTLVDVVGADRWTLRANLIADFAKDGGNHVSYAAFLKGNSADGVFERNLVVCEMRLTGGTRVGLSLGGGGTGTSSCRDGDCSVEHRGGIIRDNIIMNCPDVGIYLNRARDTKIYNNTLYQTLGIDVRFSTSTADIRNNILDGRILDRDGGTSTVADNLIASEGAWFGAWFGGRDFATWFVDPARIDFTLANGARIVDRGAALADVGDDFCGRARDDGRPDLGAIEYGAARPCDPRSMVPR